MSSAVPDVPFTVGAQIEARYRDPAVRDRILVRHDEREWSYARFRNESVRVAQFLLRRLGAEPRHVAILLENHLELLSLFGGCAYAGATLFGVNTGLQGETLLGVIEESEARLLVVDERFWSRVQPLVSRFTHISPENVLVLPTQGGERLGDPQRFDRRLLAEVGEASDDLVAPDEPVTPETNLMVIYSSGTTGLPKGINNNHFKLLAIGMTVAGRLELTPEDRGYACMPLFHSNAMFLGFMPAFHVGGSMALRERFSASRFIDDVVNEGVSYWNYVGEPVHYVLSAVEKRFPGEDERREKLTQHPDNRFRIALGNGAAAPDIDRFIEWFGLDDMYELYGSTEAAISTFRTKNDPRGCVGEVTDEAVQILDESGRQCPPAELSAEGKIENYEQAVGEICRVAPDTSLFQGYFKNDDANVKKYRDGVYHSGDLGHIVVQDGKRFLYFDGRTDDWIRKDGENFSAAQVARLLQEHPDVQLAAAYGVPCPVSDEWVMAALLLREGARFDPADFHAFCERQVTEGGMDRKWFPDFVRIVAGFEFTQTQKILVRLLKQEHFDRRRLGEEPIYFRERGDDAFRAFSAQDFETLRERFVAQERESLLDR